MARTSIRTELYDEKWDKKAMLESQRAHQFTSLIGKGTNKPIIYRPMEAITDNIPFVPDLTGTFINGSNRLKGNETAMQAYHEQVTAEWLRKAVEYDKRTVSFTAFDLRAAAKDLVVNFYKNAWRTRFIDALLSVRNSTSAGANSLYGAIVAGTNGPEIQASSTNGATITTIEGVSTTSASEAIKDGWLAANSDRVLFGSAISNNASNDHSAALATLDATDDTPRAAQISQVRRMAELASPKINPFMVKGSGDEFVEHYIYLVGSRGFRDYQADPEIRQATIDARERGMNNPVFTGGDLVYDGVTIRKIPEMPVIDAVGASSVDVGVGFLLGNQGLAYGVYQEMKSVAEVDDYDFVQGLGIASCEVIKKIFFNGKQHGVVTHYFAAPADA